MRDTSRQEFDPEEAALIAGLLGAHIGAMRLGLRDHPLTAEGRARYEAEIRLARRTLDKVREPAREPEPA